MASRNDIIGILLGALATDALQTQMVAFDGHLME